MGPFVDPLGADETQKSICRANPRADSVFLCRNSVPRGAMGKRRHGNIRLVRAPVAVFRSAMPRRILALLLWSALLVWAAGILWLSSLTRQELPDTAFLFSDKFNHFVAFAVGGWLAGSALRLSGQGPAIAGRILFTIALVAVFGAIDEALQTFTPGRVGGDLYDWIADFLGAIAGALLTLITHVRLERFVTRP
jgi:VanZ family protein